MIQTQQVRVPIAQPTLPRELDLKEPKFFVVSEKNLESFLEEVEKRSGSIVFVAITVDDYELMSYNMQEIKRYVQQMRSVIVYYRDVVEDNNSQVEE